MVRHVLYGLVGLVAAVLLLGWLGLQIRPKPFPPYQAETPPLATVPLPAGLPAPVDRFYRTVYGSEIPVITSVVIQGRGTLKPVMGIPIPARFIFVHNAGKDYRHYFEATLFGITFLKVDEGYVDGASYFESPMGTYHDDPKGNQGANLAVWAEAIWFPSLWLTDPRTHWAPVDDVTALLYVPYEDTEETFVVRFNPDTGLIDAMEAMRYRDVGEGQPKILWIVRTEDTTPAGENPISRSGSATWLDQGKPWAYFNLEEVHYNVDVSTYIRQRGR